MARYYKKGKKVYDSSTGKWLSPEKSQHYADISGGWQYLPDYVAPSATTPPATPTTPPKPPKPTTTPPPNTPARQPQTAQGINYSGLEERDGTIYNRTTGRGYATPAELAADLGIAPHQIEWGKIKKPKGNYENLVNVGGEIQTKEGRAFKSPTELASYLGIQPHEIVWKQISQAKPTAVATTDQLRAQQAEEAKPYVKYADSDKVFDREGNHITAEQAAEIPDFWNQVQMSSENRPEGLLTPIERIQSVFGADWQPSAAFTPELQAQGIYGAVKVGDDVYTIGPGGGLESPESYKEKFGRDITDTAGIAGDVDIATAIKLGITVGSDTILDPIAPLDPYEMWKKLKEEGQEDVNKLRTKLFEATQNLIDWMKGFGETKAEAKEKEKEKLKMDEKSQAIADAQTAANELQAKYDLAIEKERGRRAKSSLILGRQAKLRSLKAVELAPKLVAIQIAQGAYDRASEQLQHWSDEYDKAMDMQMTAAKLNIDSITGELNREQTEQKEDAIIKFDLWQKEQAQIREERSEVQSLMMLYPSAKISISDNFQTAYEKALPFLEDEATLKRRIEELKLKTGKSTSRTGGGGVGGASGATIETEEGQTYDLSTVAGIKSAIADGYDPASIRAYLDTNTKMTVDTINALMEEGMAGEGAGEEEEMTQERVMSLKEKGYSDDAILKIANEFGGIELENEVRGWLEEEYSEGFWGGLARDVGSAWMNAPENISWGIDKLKSWLK